MIGLSFIGSSAIGAWTALQPIVLAGLLDLLGLVTHIEQFNLEQNQGWRQVALSADLAYLEANDRIVAPSIWVVPGDEASRDASDMKIIKQITTCSVLVVSATRNYRISDKGADQAAQITHARTLLKHHVMGYFSPGFDHRLRHVSGKLMRYTDEFMVYVDEFSADYHFKKPVSTLT